ncbi:MAG: hypothetical protein FJW61_07625, partial [Actinobacteria bacterium]|nr:hypothetical protein [Actinomycetota bacterium]
QLREKIGIMFGNPETTPGGKALKYYASVRLDIRRIDNIKEGTEIIGSRTRVRVVKNKVAPPFKSAEFDIMYGKGISREGSIIDVGADLGIIVKSGSWYSYENERIGQGRENTKVFLMQNPDILIKIEKDIRAKLNLKPLPLSDSESLKLKKEESSQAVNNISKEINTKINSKRNSRDNKRKEENKKITNVAEEIELSDFKDLDL